MSKIEVNCNKSINKFVGFKSFVNESNKPSMLTERKCIAKSIPISVSEMIRKIANRSQLGIYMILLSGVEFLAYKYSDLTDGILGMPVNGKNFSNISENRMVPIRYKLDTHWTYKDMLTNVKKTVSENLECQTKNSIQDEFSYCKTIIVLENIHQVSEEDLKGIDTVFSFKAEENEILIKLEYIDGLNIELAENLLNQYINFLTIVTNQPNICISKIDLGTKSESWVLDEKNTIDSYVEPRTEVEWTIARVWGDILGIEKVGVEDNLFELGASSYTIVQIAMELSSDFIFDINDIFEFPTISSLANRVKYKKDNWKTLMKQNKELAYTARQNKESKYVLENDMEIYKNNVLKYEDVDVETKNNYQHILLTGATGFLGIHLLHDLLTNSQYELYLLVRGNTKSDAEKRLEELYKYYFGNGFNSVKERVHIINGDLAKDNFGVSKEEYNKLSDTIDCIINSAANIKHYGLAEDFYSINTDGVKRLIEFSLKGNKKDIHQISTGGVAALAERTDYYLFTEYVDELECKLNNIYLKSKYEAERLIIQAREKGINGNIYRVGEIFYNKRTKKCQKKYEEIGIYRLIKSFIQLGVIPNDKNKYMDFSFVDYVSEAITLIFDKKNILNETFHLYNSNYICLDELGDFLVEEGINLNRLEFSTFYETLFQENGDIEINNDLLAILLFLHPSRMLTLLQCGKTTKILEKFNFKWPVVQQDDIHTMMEIFKQIEFI